MRITRSICYLMTQAIVEKLREGVIPWRMPWSSGSASLPRQWGSDRIYRGANVFVLHSRSFASPYWLTWNQVKECGAQVDKGQRSSPVAVRSFQQNGECILRCVRVFNPAQCLSFQRPIFPQATTPTTPPEVIVAGMPSAPEIQHVDDKPYYMPPVDTINMPLPDTFPSSDEYHATLFHEVIHASGHRSRLDRKGVRNLASFGLLHHTEEELVAEMGASLLCAVAGISPVPVADADAYIEGWTRRLETDSRILVAAGAQAQRAADYVLGKLM